MTNDITQEQVLRDVASFIEDIAGDELTLDEPIHMGTSFNKDLELESIEFVALAERIQDAYGDDIDFVGWLSNKELDEIIQLTVGELVEFILSCR